MNSVVAYIQFQSIKMRRYEKLQGFNLINNGLISFQLYEHNSWLQHTTLN